MHCGHGSIAQVVRARVLDPLEQCCQEFAGLVQLVRQRSRGASGAFGGAQGVNMAAMGMGQFQQPQQVQQQMYAQPQQQQAMPSGVGLTSQQFGAQILQGMNQFQQQQQQQQPGLSTSPNYGTGFQQGPTGATNFSSGNPFA